MKIKKVIGKWTVRSFFAKVTSNFTWPIYRLIEEFMLLANISVAQKIHKSFPDIAFLRCHEDPKMKMLRETQMTLQTCGIHVDVDSSGGIQSSLNKYITSDFLGKHSKVFFH